MSEFKTIIIGRVGRDAELRETSTGKKVSKFSVATNPYGEKTIWVDVSSWGKRAENDAKYVRKGMLVKCEGELQSDANGRPRSYEKDGQTFVSNFELTAFDVRYLTKPEVTDTPQPDSTDEIPF